MNRTEATVRAQPEWLRAVQVAQRLPTGSRVVHTGCGTSFHAAQTGGWAVQALDAAVNPPAADVLVCVSHEGETELTLRAAERFEGAVWLVTGAWRLVAGTEKNPCLSVCGVKFGPAYMIPGNSQARALV